MRPVLNTAKFPSDIIESCGQTGYCGLKADNIHFLDMPFYNANVIQKRQISADDIDAVRGILDRREPDIVYAAMKYNCRTDKMNISGLLI
jgi:hypothetical protein